MVSHGQNMQQMLNTYLDYAQAMESFGANVMSKQHMSENAGNQHV